MTRRGLFVAFLALVATCTIPLAFAGFSPQLPVNGSAVALYTTPITYHESYQWVVDGNDNDAPAGATSWTSTTGMGVGDSTGAIVPGQSFGSLVAGTNFHWMVVAVSGQTMATMITNASANVDAIKGQRGDAGDALASEVVSFGGAENDAIAGATAATIEGEYSTYGSARKSAGWPHVICRSMLQASGVPSGVYATVNAYLRANVPGSFCDALYDPSSDARLGETNAYLDRTLYDSDSKILTQNGSTILGMGMVKAALSVGL